MIFFRKLILLIFYNVGPANCKAAEEKLTLILKMGGPYY